MRQDSKVSCFFLTAAHKYISQIQVQSLLSPLSPIAKRMGEGAAQRRKRVIFRPQNPES